MRQSICLIMATALLAGCHKQIEQKSATHQPPAANHTQGTPQLASITVTEASPSHGGNYNNINLTNPYQSLGNEGQQNNGYYTNLQSLEPGTGPLPGGGNNWIGAELGWPDGWWENEAWLQANFTLGAGPDNTTSNLPKLTAAEILLTAHYPVAAYLIYLNVDKANNETKARFNGNNGLNDKTDAFRHAYFQAINASDVGALLTRLFANAHETNVPTHLQKEKDMDLFNNQVGIDIAQQQYSATNAELSLAVKTALNNGQLRYLSPINYADPNFAFNHGITAQTQLTPTP
jgi:hypothetical protein